MHIRDSGSGVRDPMRMGTGDSLLSGAVYVTMNASMITHNCGPRGE
jgi:hypothetical protein